MTRRAECFGCGEFLKAGTACRSCKPMTNKPNSGIVSVSRVGSVGKYDEVLKPFMGMMEKELHANSGKGDRPGWLSMSADTCMLEIYYHLGKLQKAVKDGNGDGICEYAADVANLSMMLTDICGALNLFAAAQPADQQGEPDFYEVSGNGVRPGLFYTYPDWAMEDPRYTVTSHWRSAAQHATAKVDERAEFERWTVSEGRVLGYTGWNRDFAVWQARAKLNGATKVVLPERLDIPHRGEFESANQHAAAVGEAKSYNACLDEVAKLNGINT